MSANGEIRDRLARIEALVECQRVVECCREACEALDAIAAEGGELGADPLQLAAMANRGLTDMAAALHRDPPPLEP